MPPEEYASVRALREGQVVANLEMGIVKPSRDTTWINVTAAPLPLPGYGVVVAYGDVSERRRTEQELARYREHLEQLVSQRTVELLEAKEAAEAASRAKSTFLANMSHEIRTPMNAIIGLTHLVQKDIVNPKARAKLAKVQTAAQQLLRIINDILDLSRIEAGRLSLREDNFSLGQVLDQLFRHLAPDAAAKGLILTKTLDAGVPLLLWGDALRLGQILGNILSNAIKFSERGEVELQVRLLADEPTAVLLRFMVRDQGIGLTAEQQAGLFSPFAQVDGSSTRRFGGIGLGLVIAKQLAGLMGGEVGVESAPGVGSRFWFQVRLGRATALSEELGQCATDDSTATPWDQPDPRSAVPAAPDKGAPALEQAQAGDLLGRLESLLAADDTRANELWEKSHSVIEALLGAAAGRIGREVRRYEYDKALVALREALATLA
jgi:signal transduction histidine kinase